MGKYKWVEQNALVEKYDDFGLPKIISLGEEAKWSDMKEYSPTKFIKRVERWCPHCHNAETSIKPLRKLSKLLWKNYVQIVLRTIVDNKLEDFTVKDIIVSLHATGITNGDLQRKALSILSALGIIQKGMMEYTKSDGEKSIKYIFNLVKGEVFPPECYNAEKDAHSLDWDVDGVESNIFWSGSK